MARASTSRPRHDPGLTVQVTRGDRNRSVSRREDRLEPALQRLIDEVVGAPEGR